MADPGELVPTTTHRYGYRQILHRDNPLLADRLLLELFMVAELKAAAARDGFDCIPDRLASFTVGPVDDEFLAGHGYQAAQVTADVIQFGPLPVRRG